MVARFTFALLALVGICQNFAAAGDTASQPKRDDVRQTDTNQTKRPIAAEKSSAQRGGETEGRKQFVSKPNSETAVTKTLPVSPRFESRIWRNTLGQAIVSGKALGVSTDVIWIRTTRGAVVRKKLAALHPADRQHAIAKRQAILEYRHKQKQLPL